jgi:peptidoglycan/LPS O-acetylase OafA/YrhL
VTALDGLRGVAAVVVVLHHALLASSARLAAAYLPTEPDEQLAQALRPARGTLDWLLTYTPLHILWAGQEFVVVFFVLSGFVLSMPAARGGQLVLARYYPARLARLYLPVWAALALATAAHAIVAHHLIVGGSWWLNAHTQTLEPAALRSDLLLSGSAGDWGYLSVLWSLHWEMLFSLGLPLLLLAKPETRSVRFSLVLLCVISLLAGEGGATLYLPPFGLGLALAFERPRLEGFGSRLGVSRRLAGAAACLSAAATVCLLTAPWWLLAAQSEGAWPTQGRIGATLVAAGACLAVASAFVLDGWRQALSARPVQWVGRRAFSLYLVHEPFLVALAFLAAGRIAPLPFTALALAGSLALSWPFHRFVEAPTHRFARNLGERCATAVRQRRVPLSEPRRLAGGP